ncbi:MAG: response regulator [Desulfobulbaceae bacterium]|nr:response regulator [Desulfobulbaceae bacterium]
MLEQQESFPSIRLLVVDDEPIVGKRLQQVYVKLGFDVEIFTNSADALAAMVENPFQIVVTDLRMDGMDGWEVLRQARAINPETRVIVITAYAQDETANKAEQLGAFDFIAKPFRLDELKQVVYAAVEDLLRNGQSVPVNGAEFS